MENCFAQWLVAAAPLFSVSTILDNRLDIGIDDIIDMIIRLITTT